MKATLKTVLLLLLGCKLAFSLRCYDCNPTDTNMCKEPQKNNIKETDCGDAKARSASRTRQVLQFPDDEAASQECFSLYLEDTTNNKSSGIYRGCAPVNPICASNSTTQGSITNCKTCKEDKCNTDAAGDAISLTVSLMVILSSYVLVIYVM